MKPVATGFPDDDLPDFKKLGALFGADMSQDSGRVHPTDAESELQQLLNHVGLQKSVVGCVIISHGGVVVASTLSEEFNSEAIGQCALGIYMSTSVIAAKLGHEHIHQIVGKTTLGYVAVADFGGGLLVVLNDDYTVDALIPMMRSITQLVAQ